MVRWTRSFIPTLRESPAGVESAAERLLVRAGFVRAVSTGVYGYLPLGTRSLARLAGIAREELMAAGGQEIVLDAAAAAEIARGELRSPKQLPQIWYRIETPLLRARQFAGLDVYWFGDAREAVEGALRRIAGRAGVAAAWSRHGAVVLDDAGADLAAACSGCGAAAPAGLA
ncbi:MAG: hypothetical protein KGN36_16855, partial [Acidobacteriota bacterium]|nr:hypothetical protein [Acidobacteriota bacterium]